MSRERLSFKGEFVIIINKFKGVESYDDVTQIKSEIIELINRSDLSFSENDILFELKRTLEKSSKLSKVKFLITIANSLINLQYEDILDQLLNKLVDSGNFIDFINFRENPQYSTFFHKIIKSGNVEIVKLLINNSLAANCGENILLCKDDYGNTALHLATKSQNREIIELIFSTADRLNILDKVFLSKDDYGFSALYYAIEYSNIETIDLLFNMQLRNYLTLRDAILYQDQDNIKENIINIALKNRFYGKDDSQVSNLVIRKLQDLGLLERILLDETTKEQNPLQVAISTESIDKVKLILDVAEKNFAILNFLNPEGVDTVFSRILFTKNIEIFHIIVSKAAQYKFLDKMILNLVSNEYYSPIYQAFKYGFHESIEFIFNIAKKINLFNEMIDKIFNFKLLDIKREDLKTYKEFMEYMLDKASESGLYEQAKTILLHDKNILFMDETGKLKVKKELLIHVSLKEADIKMLSAESIEEKELYKSQFHKLLKVVTSAYSDLSSFDDEDFFGEFSDKEKDLHTDLSGEVSEL